MGAIFQQAMRMMDRAESSDDKTDDGNQDEREQDKESSN